MKINQSPVKSKKIQPNLVNPRTNPQKPTKNLGKKNIKKKSTRLEEYRAGFPTGMKRIPAVEDSMWRRLGEVGAGRC